MRLNRVKLYQKASTQLCEYIQENGWPDEEQGSSEDPYNDQVIEIIGMQEEVTVRPWPDYLVPVYIMEARIKYSWDKYTFRATLCFLGAPPSTGYYFEFEPVLRRVEADPRQLVMWSSDGRDNPRLRASKRSLFVTLQPGTNRAAT